MPDPTKNKKRESPPSRESPWEFAVGPAPENWDDWVELDARAWPEKRERRGSDTQVSTT